MFHLKKGNLLLTDAEAVVNTVNCVGVMGKGIALQFKQAYPANFKAYAAACKTGEVQPGHMFVYETGYLGNPRWIINFPTKRHWKGVSKLEDIKKGLEALVEEIKKHEIKSIAIPPLGCGSGGLDWRLIKPIIEKALGQIHHVDIHLYEPIGAPQADAMPVAVKKTSMTRARALFIKLLEQYAIPGYRLTLLEVQKLAYFLQIGGEPLRLIFSKKKFGPYAANLNHVLQTMEGQFIRGYGDRSAQATIYPLVAGIKTANELLESMPDAATRLYKVKELITGFETPYGMELLATVHWVATQEPDIPKNIQTIIEKVWEWNPRKKVRFKEIHISKAFDRLTEKNWIACEPTA